MKHAKNCRCAACGARPITRYDGAELAALREGARLAGVALDPDPADLTDAEILGALSRAYCECGHLLGEHGPNWCSVLACGCRSYVERDNRDA